MNDRSESEALPVNPGSGIGWAQQAAKAGHFRNQHLSPTDFHLPHVLIRYDYGKGTLDSTNTSSLPTLVEGKSSSSPNRESESSRRLTHASE